MSSYKPHKQFTRNWEQTYGSNWEDINERNWKGLEIECKVNGKELENN